MLEGDRTEHASFRPSAQSLFGFHGCLKTVRPMPLVHHSPGVLVHNLDPGVTDDVIHITSEKGFGMKRAIDRLEQGPVFVNVEAAASKRGLNAFDACIGEEDVAMVVVGFEISARNQGSNKRYQTACIEGCPIFRAGNDEGNPGFVNEDRIRFIDKNKVETAVDERIAVISDLIAKEIEAGLFAVAYVMSQA